MGEPDIEGSALELRESNGRTLADGTMIGGLLGIEAVRHASAYARELLRVVAAQDPEQKKRRPLVVTIRGKGGRESKHLALEAWQTLGKMVGVTARPLEPVPFDDGWKAGAEAIRLTDGAVIGAGWSVCLRSEQYRQDDDDYALCGMAQSRAMSRALRSVLAEIVVLAGYDPTPSDEMAAEPAARPQTRQAQVQTKTPRAKGTRQRSPGEPITPDQRRLYFAKVRGAGLWGKRKAQEALLLWVTGDSKIDHCPKADFDRLLQALAQWQAVADEARAIASGELQAASDDQLRRAGQVARRFDEAGV